MTTKNNLLPSLLLTLLAAAPAFCASVTVRVDRPGARINPAMWGVFFEDINFGADGGLYAELVKNRSFDFPEPLTGWDVPGASVDATRVTVASEASASGGQRHHLRLESTGGPAALENGGFRGIGVKAGETYDFSATVRAEANQTLQVDLVAASGAILGTTRIASAGDQWSDQKGSLVAAFTDPRARLRLTLTGKGVLELARVSLFPRNTWKQRPGGLRADMVQALADFGPGFVRFPGGCIVEGSRLELRYQWKKTLGPVADRAFLFNRWNAEIKHRPTPDYFQTFGLGFFEYFQLCEDLGAEPLPILNCGMACQFNTGELVPLDKLDPFIQDALDLIDFANAPAANPWGARRVALGHPEPFHMKMLGVGNEQWGPQYMERFARFAEAIRAKHPEIALVGAAGPSPDDPRFAFAWAQMRAMRADIVDEHCYDKPEWFLNNAHRYDKYDRAGPKVFMGEYAAQSVATVSPDNKNTWGCALAEAAYMTGLERNADVVRMASYAPLFAHVDAWQWTPDLIWTDNLHTLLTPSYHVQRLFARNRGDVVLPVELKGLSAEQEQRVYASSSLDEATGEVIVKLVNATAHDATETLEIAGVPGLKSGKLTTVQAPGLDSVNTFDNPELVAPHESSLAPSGNSLELSLPANSFSILRLGVKR